MSAIFALTLFVTQIVGQEFVYTVQPGDSATTIGARFGTDARVLLEANQLNASDRLDPGQNLTIDNRHIVPSLDDAGLTINLPQRMLFQLSGNELTCACPIAAGKPGWRTPLGEFTVLTKEEHPTWDVPPSIQWEMRRSGKPVITTVPPSAKNPLGEYWIGLSLPGIGIHGTNAPSSIYKLATHGCIRLHPDDIRTVFDKITVGGRVRLIYEPVLLARVGDYVFLEVHPDPYKMESDPMAKALQLSQSEGVFETLDLDLVREVIQKRDGIARNVTRH